MALKSTAVLLDVFQIQGFMKVTKRFKDILKMWSRFEDLYVHEYIYKSLGNISADFKKIVNKVELKAKGRKKLIKEHAEQRLKI